MGTAESAKAALDPSAVKELRPSPDATPHLRVRKQTQANKQPNTRASETHTQTRAAHALRPHGAAQAGTRVYHETRKFGVSTP